MKVKLKYETFEEWYDVIKFYWGEFTLVNKAGDFFTEKEEQVKEIKL